MACLSVGRLHQLCRKAWCLRYDPRETLVMLTLANPTLHTYKYALLSIRTVRLPLTASISMYIAYTHMNTHHSSFSPLPPSLPPLRRSFSPSPAPPAHTHAHLCLPLSLTISHRLLSLAPVHHRYLMRTLAPSHIPSLPHGLTCTQVLITLT